MPLKKGSSKATISKNIATEMHAGKSKKKPKDAEEDYMESKIGFMKAKGLKNTGC